MPKRNLAWILVIVMIALLMWQLPQTIARRDSVSQAFGPLVDVRAEIRRRSVNPIDDQRLIDAAVSGGIAAMLDVLQDPYALYLTEREYTRFQERTEGVFGGLGVDVWAVDDGLEVLSVEQDSPAAAAGISPGDVITHVDDKPVAGLPFVESVNNLLNGPPDSEVSLTLVSIGDSRAPEMRRLTLRRAVIHVDPVQGWSRTPTGGWEFMIDPKYRIGYIRLNKFLPNAVERVDAAMEGLLRERTLGLVLDLRDNTGGLLNAARDLADRFLDDGLIVSTGGDKSDGKRWFATRDGTYPPISMAVLINQSTASAAEIVAGALRDNKRAVIVGEHSYGKGSVQEVVRLPGHGGALKLTTAYYFLPSGECIQRTAKSQATGVWGVKPNLIVNMTDRQRQRWVAVWRELQKPPQPPVATSRSTEEIPVIGAEEVDAADVRAKQLLDVDVQLDQAVDALRRGIGKSNDSDELP